MSMPHHPFPPPNGAPATAGHPRRGGATAACALAVCAAAATWPSAAVAASTTPTDQRAAYEAEAGRAGDPARGQAWFNADHGQSWRCASCHGAVPTAAGRHAATGKPIAALAPAAEPRRFTDAAKTEKWFGRNCRDVLGRVCSAGEKADVLAWLIGLKP